ncbi:MAG: pilus assembly protein N-terminal domain-containing protein, partial [Planctomycetaceae bacterium]|nr:pilus assembly protein N-terminal domain-containing protein [Planctomycetaceae bacterium]
MTLRCTLLLVTIFWSWTTAAPADPLPNSGDIVNEEPLAEALPPKPPQATDGLILLNAKVCQVSSAKLKQVLNGLEIKAPVSFEVSNQSLNLAFRQLQGKVLVEPTLVTTEGHTATFLSGGEMALPAGGNKNPDVEWLSFGTECQVSPRLLDDGKIGLQFRFEQTERTFPDHSKDETKTNDIALASGVVSKGRIVVRRDHSLVALLPDPEGDEKTLLMIALTPKVADAGQGELAPSGTPPSSKKNEPAPTIEFQSQPSATLNIHERVTLLLKVAESGTIVSPENIRQVSGFRSDVVAVSGLGPRKLQVQAKQLGESEMWITDVNSNRYRVFVQVRAKSGPEAVKDILAELFPKAQVKVFALNESL